MNGKQIMEALNDIDYALVEDAGQGLGATVRKPRRRRWVAGVAVAAACLCLVGGGTIHTLGRLGYFTESCSADIGTAVDGVYYFEAPRDGIYAYTEATGAQKLISAYWYDRWEVNGYGVYYTRGMTLYVLPHGAERATQLYTAADGKRLDFGLCADGRVRVTVVGRVDGVYKALRRAYLDGVSGELASDASEDTVFRLGDRTLRRVAADGGCTLVEDGRSLLPDGVTVGYGEVIGEEGILFYVSSDSSDSWTMLAVFASGEDRLFTIDGSPSFGLWGRYVLYIRQDGLWCMDVDTGEAWELTPHAGAATELSDADTRFYEFVVSGDTVYACAPWSGKQSRWRLELDEAGRPTALSLLDDNILP